MMRKRVFIALWLGLGAGVVSTSACQGRAVVDKQVKTGNEHYANGEYAKSFEAYNESLNKNGIDTSKIHYNLGLATFMQSHVNEAEDAELNLLEKSATFFTNSGGKSGDVKVQSLASYNLGNIRFIQSRFEDAVSAYRSALEIQPNFKDATHNLELALRRLSNVRPKNSMLAGSANWARETPSSQQTKSASIDGQGTNTRAGHPNTMNPIVDDEEGAEQAINGPRFSPELTERQRLFDRLERRSRKMRRRRLKYSDDRTSQETLKTDW